MKKRKELDALVANGKVGKRAKKGSGSCSAHELLRHDSDSSDMEDFSIIQPRRTGRKKNGSRLRLSTVCLPLCQFVLVSTCILVSGTLIWLHIGLREDLDLLRAHLQKVQADGRNTPEALHFIHMQLQQLDRNVSSLFHEIKKITSNINSITSEVEHQKQVTSYLQESIAAAPAIEKLPKDVHSLTESVASFGSKVTAFESTVRELKEQVTNYQSKTEVLSGEMDNVKITLHELTNNSDSGSKTLINSLPSDASVQKAIQETNESVNVMRKELFQLAKSMDNISSGINSQLNSYKELQVSVDKNHESVEFLDNTTQKHIMRILAIENLIQNNLIGRIVALESGKSGNGSILFPSETNNDIQRYINNSISNAVLKILNVNFTDMQNLENSSQVFKHKHDALLLLAAILEQFSGLPAEYMLEGKNATEIASSFFDSALGELLEKYFKNEHKLTNVDRFHVASSKTVSNVEIDGSNQKGRKIPIDNEYSTTDSVIHGIGNSEVTSQGTEETTEKPLVNSQSTLPKLQEIINLGPVKIGK